MIFIDKGKYNEMKHDYFVMPVDFLIFMHYYSFNKYSLNTSYVSATVPGSEDMLVDKIEWPLFAHFEFTIY